MNNFGDMKIYGYFFGGGDSPRNWTIFRCNFYAFGSFLYVKDFLGVAKISNIFEVLEIPDISWG